MLLLRGARLVRQASSIAPNYAKKIGQREVVGFGHNGLPNYFDRPDFPFPAIRYQADTPDIKALREKEKGDWKLLTLAEKKALYRASFCQTFAEQDAPTGEWKSVIGWGLIFASLGIWLHIFVKYLITDENSFPASTSDESQLAQLKRMLAFRANPIEGISSKWDFEKNEWKK